MLTKEQVAEKFIEAVKGNVSISNEDIRILGLDPIPKGTSWFEFCGLIYKHVTGKEIEPCSFIDREISSRWYGKKVSDAILGKE